MPAATQPLSLSTGRLTRSAAGKAIRGGQVAVNGERVRTPDRHIDPNTDEITLGGEVLTYRRYTYILLNKPDGYVSATEDGNDPTVLTLLPEDPARAVPLPDEARVSLWLPFAAAILAGLAVASMTTLALTPSTAAA